MALKAHLDAVKAALETHPDQTAAKATLDRLLCKGLDHLDPEIIKTESGVRSRLACHRWFQVGSLARSRKPRNESASWVTSSGRTYFVDGLAPSALNASRYWRAIVFWSTCEAAW